MYIQQKEMVCATSSTSCVYACIDRVGVCLSIKISESSKITGQRSDAVEGIIIYWQIQTINQADRSSDREQKLKGRILLLDH